MNISLIKSQIQSKNKNHDSEILDNVLVEKIEEILGEEEEKKYWEPINYELKYVNIVIDSLIDPKFTKNGKFIKKKSYKNFIDWLDIISNKLMDEKRKNDEIELFSDK
jgi:hypothetical protein